MAQSPIIYALVAKRSEIGGIIADLEELARQARADLAHIDATLRMFDPDAIPQQIRHKRPAKGRSGPFANGEISRRVRVMPPAPRLRRRRTPPRRSRRPMPRGGRRACWRGSGRRGGGSSSALLSGLKPTSRDRH